jgi:hypothetical protein
MAINPTMSTTMRNVPNGFSASRCRAPDWSPSVDDPSNAIRRMSQAKSRWMMPYPTNPPRVRCSSQVLLAVREAAPCACEGREDMHLPCPKARLPKRAPAAGPALSGGDHPGGVEDIGW